MKEKTVQKLPHIPALPSVPATNTRYIITGDTKKKVTREEFDEWYLTAPFDDYLDEIHTVGKDGEDHVSYRLSPIYFARALASRLLPVSFSGITYFYDKDTCLYTKDAGELSSWVRRQIEEAVLSEKLPNSLKPETIVREVVGQACGMKIISGDTYPFNLYPGFPVNNGVIVFHPDGSIAVEKYRPDMLFTRKIPWDYNPAADPSKAKEVLKRWLDEDWEWILQIAAQAIVQSLPDITPFKQAYMIVGEHDSGKSSVNTMMQYFFGKGNVSTRTLQSFNERFAKGDLVGKWMNFGDDLTSFKINEGNEFKSIVGFSDTTVEQKYRDSFKARLTAVHVYSANTLPELDNGMYGDVAWWSRWAIIEFTNHFERDPSWANTHLDREFFEGFLLLVLDKASQIVRDARLPLTQDWHEVKQKWIGSTSRLHEFIELSIEFAPGHLMNKQCFFDAMEDWALNHMPYPSYVVGEEAVAQWRRDQRARLPDSISVLTHALRMEGISTVQASSRKTAEGEIERPWMYKDIDFKPVIWAKLPPFQGVGV